MDELINLVEDYNGTAMTTSLKIAKVFGKEHVVVLRKIKEKLNLFSTDDNFIASEYTDITGRKLPMYLLDRDFATYLIMGFTGSKADEWKLKYIAAFNAMEEKLKQSNILTEEEKLKLQLFSKNPVEVSAAYNRLTEIEIEKATLPLKQEITHQQNTITEQKKEIKIMKPKVNYFDIAMQCKDLVSTTDIAKDYGWSAVKLNNFLKSNKIQYKRGNTWYLYQKYSEKGYSSTKTNVYYGKDGQDHAKVHMYWTQKGRLFIYKVMKDAGYLPLIEQNTEIEQN